MTPSEVVNIINRAWYIRAQADVTEKLARSFPVVDNEGVWHFVISYNKVSEVRVPVFTAKFYTFSGKSSKSDFEKGVKAFNISGIGIMKVNTYDFDIVLGKNYCLDANGGIPATGYSIKHDPVIMTKLGTVVEAKVSAKIFKPKNDMGCECGAFAVGAKKGDSNHSDWCPAKGSGKKLQAKKG